MLSIACPVLTSQISLYKRQQSVLEQLPSTILFVLLNRVKAQKIDIEKVCAHYYEDGVRIINNLSITLYIQYHQTTNPHINPNILQKN